MKLTSGRITIPIERDGKSTGEISFDPQDIGFAEGFFALMEGLAAREKEYRAAPPEAVGERLRQMAELCGWLREQVEAVFGQGSATVLFGESCSLVLFRQFFEGIEPFVRQARAQKTAKFRAASAAVME